MPRVYGLKRATPKMKYHHMNFMVDWQAELRLPQTVPPDRHTALERIKTLLGSEAFEAWFNQVYALRKQGRDTEYEQTIFEKLKDLRGG